MSPVVETARPLVSDDLAWETAAEGWLSEPVIDSLVYTRDVEGFSNSYLVGLGADRTTLGDDLIRGFLDVWRSEEAAQARALDAFLVHYGAGQDVEIPQRQPPPSAVGP